MLQLRILTKIRKQYDKQQQQQQKQQQQQQQNKQQQKQQQQKQQQHTQQREEDAQIEIIKKETVYLLSVCVSAERRQTAKVYTLNLALSVSSSL